ncbi:Nitrogen fixation protein of unknown function [Planctomycetes bacterium Pan216]|uniref:Nif11 domain-containing protein n=1 Tax=Kolteria novifilia TaxID=2527975 RepID=A0A518B6L3_9BACT|nr:Nitrogen fixation protein of unknown function [Planctomycetes bacterium Pan216]
MSIDQVAAFLRRVREEDGLRSRYDSIPPDAEDLPNQIARLAAEEGYSFTPDAYVSFLRTQATAQRDHALPSSNEIDAMLTADYIDEVKAEIEAQRQAGNLEDDGAAT